MTFLSIFSDAKWLTVERVRRIAIVFAVLGLALMAVDAWMRTRHGVTDVNGSQLGRDFVNYWSGAHLAAEGHGAHVYDIDGFTRYERAHTAPNAELKWYGYPPIMLLLSLPLAATGFIWGLILWLLAGFIACAALLKRYLGWRMAILAAVATPASLLNAVSGQNGQFSAALLGGGVIFLEDRPWLAGCLFGLLSFKPQLAILVPLALAAGGYWRAFIAAAAMVLALFGLSFLVFGHEAWTGFMRNAPINLDLLEHFFNFWNRMPTPFAAMRLAGSSVSAAFVAQSVSASGAAFLAARIWHSRASLNMKGCTLILATFLTSPYAWDYDLVVLIFVVMWFAADAAQTGFGPWEKIMLAMIIAMPLFLPLFAVRAHLQLGPLALWAALLITARRALQPATNPLGQLHACAKQQA